MKIKLHFLVLVLALVFVNGFAQDGTIDTSFGQEGYNLVDFSDGSDFPVDLVFQNDQKIIIAGIAYVENSSRPAMVRFQTNGEIDLTFATQGKFIGGNPGHFISLGVQSDNKIITLSKDGSGTLIMTRFLENGEIDTTFGQDGTITFANYGGILKVLNDDKIIIVTKSNTESSILVTRYLSTGLIDESFGINGTTSSLISNSEELTFKEFKIKSDGTMYLLGSKYFDTHYEVDVYKFLQNGSLDETFAENGVIRKEIEYEGFEFLTATFDVSESGKIILATNLYDCDVNEEGDDYFSLSLSSYLLNGMPDDTFGENGIKDLGSSHLIPGSVIIQGNGRILLVGGYTDCFESAYFGIRRYTSNGDNDGSFGNSGVIIDYFFEGGRAYLQEDGKIIGVGYTFFYMGDEDIIITRYNNSPLGVAENELQGLTVAPNPSEGIFTLNYKMLNSKTSYQISDITGKIIQTGILKPNKTEIDLSSVQSGMYFLKTSNSVIRLLKK